MTIVTCDNDSIRTGWTRPGRPRHRWPSLVLAALVWLPGTWVTEALAQASRTEDAKLTAANGVTDDFFGFSVALAGDRAIVGAVQKDEDGGRFAGAAYVFERDGRGGWTEVAELAASDGAGRGVFGTSVAFDGDRALVGAPGGLGANGDFAGAAYVFEPDGRGGWTETAKLTASDGAEGDGFGDAVALAGDRALVGASRDDEAGIDAAGSAYLFERDGRGGWTEAAKLTASDGGDSDLFGASVALTDERALVGAFRNSNDAGILAGAAYVFEPDGQDRWVETAKLTASDGARFDTFGTAVALAGDRAIAGAPGAADGSGVETGAAYVFDTDERGGWTETAKLTASDGEAPDSFGRVVAIAADRVLIGAEGDWNERGDGAGAAYLFELDGQGGWTETKLAASDGAEGDTFGISVALTDERAIVGAYFDDRADLTNVGAVYVFDIAALDDTDDDGVADAIDHCPATHVPEAQVPAFGHLWRGRVALTGERDDDGTARFTNRRGRALFTIERTRGCSCEQILVQQARHLDHRRSETVFRLFDQWFGGCYKSTLRRFGRDGGR